MDKMQIKNNRTSSCNWDQQWLDIFMYECSVVMHQSRLSVCLSVCISLVWALTFDCVDLQTSVLIHPGTSSDSLGQGQVSRSWGQGQGQGHTSV